jgi:hypothetical protein
MNNNKLMIAVVAAPLLAGASGVLAQPGGAPVGASVQTEARPNRNRETTRQAPQNESSTEFRENRTEGNKATNGATEARRLEQNRATNERESYKDRNRATTGQGATPTKDIPNNN